MVGPTIPEGHLRGMGSPIPNWPQPINPTNQYISQEQHNPHPPNQELKFFLLISLHQTCLDSYIWTFKNQLYIMEKTKDDVFINLFTYHLNEVRISRIVPYVAQQPSYSKPLHMDIRWSTSISMYTWHKKHSRSKMQMNNMNKVLESPIV